MDKMTEMIGELRENCNALQKDLLSARQDDVRLVLNVLLPSMYHHHLPSAKEPFLQGRMTFHS